MPWTCVFSRASFSHSSTFSLFLSIPQACERWSKKLHAFLATRDPTRKLDYDTVVSPVASAASVAMARNQSKPFTDTTFERLPQHRFPLEGTVTSLAIAPDGLHVVVGFSDGTIFLYELTSIASNCGILLGQIVAKGLHNSLLLHVAVPSDGAFAFCGVYRGSTEMIAWELPSRDHDGSWLGNAHTYPRFAHSHSKLKGFGACAVVRAATDSAKAKYHLCCGRGIKNLHVWSFVPGSTREVAEWQCLYDEKTNGMTIDFFAFRSGNPHIVINRLYYHTLTTHSL
jgi:hypothetical protein